MPKVKISEYSTVNSNNTDINSINIDEGCAPSGINNAIREVMVHLKNWQTNASGDGATFASLVVQGTGSFTGAVTMSAGATLSGTNTLSGSNIMSGNINSSGTNTFSGSQVISGNINSSGSTNTFSGTVVMSGANTISYAAGSVSAPAANRNGDTDTGIYFPAANEVAVAAGGSVAAAFNSHQFMGMRNRIINGDMRIDQRNAGASVTLTSGGNFPVDRFQGFEDTDGAMTAQQDSSAPAGFINSVKLTTTTADGSLSASQYALFRQMVEGTNVADLAWGTASAKTVTLSFWVRSSLTGTFGGALGNSAFNRSYPFTYSISVADTWEYKTVTIAGDTSGTWLTTTGTGIRVNFGLGVGTDYNGTAGAWAGAGYLSATGATSVIGTLNATWYITGVQLEVGSTATPFERRPYGTELALCQRYYSRLSAATSNAYVAFGSNVYTSATSANGFVKYPTTMRASATVSYGGAISFGRGIALVNITGVGTTYAGTDSVLWQPSGLTGGADKDAGVILASNDTSAFVAFSAEL